MLVEALAFALPLVLALLSVPVLVPISVMNGGGLLPVRGIDCRARTSGVRVAVKSSVWRSLDAGRAERHVSTSGSILPGPLVSSRSASSRTTMRTRLSPHTVSCPDVLM